MVHYQHTHPHIVLKPRHDPEYNWVFTDHGYGFLRGREESSCWRDSFCLPHPHILPEPRHIQEFTMLDIIAQP